MRLIGHERKTDWPKLGPSLLIATALVVAIRTSKWASRQTGDPLLSDVDHEMDREVGYAIRITVRVMHELVKRHPSLFPELRQALFDGVHEEDIPK